MSFNPENDFEPQHAKIASPRLQVADVSDVNISLSKNSADESMDSDRILYHPSVLIADDDMVQLKGLEGQVKYVRGPDGND